MKIAKLMMPLGIILAVVLASASPVMAQPVTSPFTGDVTIDDEPAPDGSEVAAYVGDEIEPRETTTTTGGAYEMVLFGTASDVDLAVSFKVKKAGTEEWLDATTDPESPTYANYDPQVVNLSAYTTPPPVAAFSASPLSGDEPLTVVFSDESLNMTHNPTWAWDFGDGATGTGQNPARQYLEDGSYTVTLTVTTDEGTDDEVKVGYITVADTGPMASFTADPTSGDRPLEVSFTDGSTSYDGIVSYEWDFSYDGVTFNVESTEQNPSLTYEMEGTFSVALRVTEADADSDTMVAVDLISVGIPLPVAAFSASPLSGDEPLTVVFSDESLNMTDNPTWVWDFGDGGTSTEQSPTHQYLEDGSYTVTLTVTTDEGTDDEVKADYITVADTEPTASFTADPTSGDLPLEVSFTDGSTSYDGITSYEWDFGDGGTSTEQSPTYTYETEGIYSVALRVTEADEDTSTMVAEDLISVSPPADITDPVIEYAGVGYRIGAESARPGGSFYVEAVVTDDTAVTLVEIVTPFDTFPLSAEVYEGITFYWIQIELPEDSLFGTYEVTLRAEDAAGNEATQSLELEVVPALTAYNITLADGWNLISLPLIPDVTATATVLNGLSFLGEDIVRAVLGDEVADSMMPDVDKVWHYDAAGGQWLFFEPASGVGDLTELADGKGYWVEVVEEVPSPILTVYGVELVPGGTVPPTYAVVEGWNLIGFKQTRSMEVTEYLSAVDGKYARLYAYDAENQVFYLVGGSGYPDMHPGKGYWIYMTEGGYIVP